MLKGSTLQNLHYDAIALVALMLVCDDHRRGRFRRTLD
jgi:ABC-2 type transport system permease protein